MGVVVPFPEHPPLRPKQRQIEECDHEVYWMVERLRLAPASSSEIIKEQAPG